MNTAHKSDLHAVRFAPHTWRPAGEAQPYESCSYCGSMSPKSLAHAITSLNARLEPTDRKYGWPHKFYVRFNDTHAKFYTLHLKDATPEERETIEGAIGLRFSWNEDDGVAWFSTNELRSQFIRARPDEGWTV